MFIIKHIDSLNVWASARINMVSVKVEKELQKFEADIRDLCMAFFPYQKVVVEEERYKVEGVRGGEHCELVYVDNFFDGKLTGDRKKDKSEIKRQLYNYLSKLTHKKLLWGTLTGIRPVTIVTDMIESKACGNRLGKMDVINDNVIKAELKKEYLINDEKADELITIARKEIDILNREEICDYKDRYSMYIGVPFCKSTCLYCSFTSFNIDKYGGYVNEYLDKLEKELAHDGEKWSPMSIYIGGGTPTSLSEKDFEKLLDLVDEYVDLSKCVEYTVEAGRADTITYEKLKLMKEHGVTRISINPQSFNQKTLDLIGRKHTVKDVVEKYNMARGLGFDNINMDIILGLPDERLFEVIKTLFNLYKLKPDSFTVHSLALKRAARLNVELDSWTRGHYLAGLVEADKTEGKRTIDKMYGMSNYLAKLISLEPYYLYRQKNMAGNLENIGYSELGKECIYNIMMMSERHTVYGFGTATSKYVYYENGGKRIENSLGYKSVIDYCKSV